MSASSGSGNITTQASAILPETVTASLNSAQNALQSAVTRFKEGESPSNVIRSVFSGSNPDGVTNPNLSGNMAPIFMTGDGDAAFKSFAVAAGLLGTKLIFNSAWTVRTRVTREIFTHPEDCDNFSPGKKPVLDDLEVERVRRMHQNDLENFAPFLILGMLYSLSRPCALEANTVFGLFTACRLGHTVSYLGMRAQPARFYFFLGGLFCNTFLAYKVLRAYVF